MDHNVLHDLAEQLAHANSAIKASMEYISRLEADNRVMRQLLIDMASDSAKAKEKERG